MVTYACLLKCTGSHFTLDGHVYKALTRTPTNSELCLPKHDSQITAGHSTSNAPQILNLWVWGQEDNTLKTNNPKKQTSMQFLKALKETV